MKKLITATITAVLLASSVTAFAGGACCPSKKAAAAKSAATDTKSCFDMLSKLNLTDEQKAKLAALKEECDKTGCTETSRAKMTKGLKEILTPEQLAACKTACEKQGVKECPIQNSGTPTNTKG